MKAEVVKRNHPDGSLVLELTFENDSEAKRFYDIMNHAVITRGFMAQAETIREPLREKYYDGTRFTEWARDLRSRMVREALHGTCTMHLV
jgi:hypothetical protein